MREIPACKHVQWDGALPLSLDLLIERGDRCSRVAREFKDIADQNAPSDKCNAKPVLPAGKVAALQNSISQQNDILCRLISRAGFES